MNCSLSRSAPLPTDAVCVSVGSRPVTRDWPDWCASSAAVAVRAGDCSRGLLTSLERARLVQSCPKGVGKTRHYTSGEKGRRRRIREPRACRSCQVPFTPRNPLQFCCSVSCRVAWLRSPERQARESERNRANYQRRLRQIPEAQRQAREVLHQNGLKSAKRRAAERSHSRRT